MWLGLLVWSRFSDRPGYMSYMWHDHGEWVTCRQFSIFTFQCKSLVHLKCYTFWSKPHLHRTSGCRDMTDSLTFKHNIIHKHLSFILACNSKSIFLTSDSFPLIMSHINLHSNITHHAKECWPQRLNCPVWQCVCIALHSHIHRFKLKKFSPHDLIAWASGMYVTQTVLPQTVWFYINVYRACISHIFYFIWRH